MSREPIGERVAVVETEVKAIRAEMAQHREEMSSHHDEVKKALATIIDNQKAGAADREQIKADMALMKPHVQTVAAAKAFWAVSAWISATFAAIGAAFWGVWMVIHPYIKLPWR
jgi:hypothetical protein